jgi:oligopeptide transport system substrate-binding protein
MFSEVLRRFRGAECGRGSAKAHTKASPAIRCLLCSILSVSLITGCTRSESSADLVIINGAEPESLDPALLTGQADGRVALALFEGLTRYNPTNAAPTPGLAERWEIAPDGKIYTFYLRTNALWSTGGPITAHDFVYSWLRVLDPVTAGEYAGVLFYVRNGEAFNTGKLKDHTQVGVKAIDDRTLQVELVDPTPFFLDLCAYPTLAAVPRQAIHAHGDRWLMEHPVPTSGAYQLLAWRVNDKIRMRKNLRYWDAANTQTEIVDLLPCINANTALNLYETGAADIVWDKNLVPVEMLDLLLKRPDFHSYDFLGTYFYRYNVTKRPFDDPRIRKAFALVIDKKRIVGKITKGGERIASGYTPPGVGGYEPPQGLGYDPGLARKLLAEAGFPGGKGFPVFHFLFDTSSTLHEQIAIELQEMWRRELGIQAGLRKLEWKTYLRAQAELDFDLCRSSWIGDYNDPNTFLDMFMSNNGNNRTGWKSGPYDQLLRAANAQLDPAKRFRTLQQAETLLVREDAPIVPLYIYTGIEYYDSSRIQGVFPNLRAEHPIRAIRKLKPVNRPSAAPRDSVAK